MSDKKQSGKAIMNWDLSSYFREFGGPEMTKFNKELAGGIVRLERKAKKLGSLRASNAAQWEKVLLECEELLERFNHLSSYIGCLSACDARNESYRREDAAMAQMGAEFAKVEVEILRMFKTAKESAFKSFSARKSFEGATYYLGRLRKESRRTMSSEKEILAADLGVDGIHAWGRLYDTLTGKLEFDMEYPDGRHERVPASQRRSLLDNPDRRIRRAAFDGGNEAYQKIEDVAAAALNALSGTRHTLNRHRGIRHFLDVALFQASISRKTLDAMFEAVFANIGIARRIFKVKARALGLPKVAWYDLGAQLSVPDQEKLSWDKGRALVKNSFARAYPALGNYLQSAVDHNWIEWEPRPGKQSGAFCTGSLLTRESRVFMTFNQSLGDVRTLAHEIGHAFHSFVLRDVRTYAHFYPMTLAESASTFAEMILNEGILSDPAISESSKLLTLNSALSDAAIFLLDIPVRYEFEKAFYEERAKGELTVSRLKELMVETQRRVFGDVLEKGGEDPLFWASKLHFYITGVTFYNFPYTFGYLLSRGLFALFKKEGPDFLPKYEAFLRLTGSDTAERVARRSIGRDLTKPDFWEESIRSLKEPLREFESRILK
ncbi:MAG: M3 family oligoendopeptidase [bacterium]